MYSCQYHTDRSVESHEDHWDHRSNEGWGHVHGRVCSICALHLNGEVIHLHLEVSLCKSVVHASEHWILFTALSIGENGTDATHFRVVSAVTVFGIGALLGHRSFLQALRFHSILKVFVELDSIFLHRSLFSFSHVISLVLLPHLRHFPWNFIVITTDIHLLIPWAIVCLHRSINSVVIDGEVHCCWHVAHFGSISIHSHLWFLFPFLVHGVVSWVHVVHDTFFYIFC